MDALIERHRGEIVRIARTHGADRVRVFGSMALGCSHEDSDVDLLVDLQPGRSLLDLIAIKQDLEDLLGRRVDVLTEPAVSRYVRDEVVRAAIPL